MADHSKFGHDALLTFCNIEDLTAIVTDTPLAPEYQNVVDKKRIQLLYPRNDM